MDAVSSNRLVPSASTVGASGWFPVPSVSAGKARIDSVIAWSMAAPCSGVMAACSSADMPIAAAPSPAPSPMVRLVVMPESSCPAISQYSS